MKVLSCLEKVWAIKGIQAQEDSSMTLERAYSAHWLTCRACREKAAQALLTIGRYLVTHPSDGLDEGINEMSDLVSQALANEA